MNGNEKKNRELTEPEIEAARKARAAYMRKYREQNAERIKEQRREYRRSNRDRINAYRRAYRAAHPEVRERDAESMREYRRKHPEEAQRQTMRYWASKAARTAAADQREGATE